MNRLVKFIGYNPKGYSPSTLELTINTSTLGLAENASPTLYKYSAIDVGKTDKNGKRIWYSTVDNVYVNSNIEFSTLFYNGLWKLYSSTFTSNGQPY